MATSSRAEAISVCMRMERDGGSVCRASAQFIFRMRPRGRWEGRGDADVTSIHEPPKTEEDGHLDHSRDLRLLQTQGSSALLIPVLLLRRLLLPQLRKDPFRARERDMTDQVFKLLGEGIVMDPVRGSRLLERGELHELLELTGGTVYLRRTNWRIVPHRHGKEFVKVQLRQE